MNAELNVNFTFCNMSFRTNSDASVIEQKVGDDWYVVNLVNLTQQNCEQITRAAYEATCSTLALHEEAAKSVHQIVMALNNVDGGANLYLGNAQVEIGKEGRISIHVGPMTGNPVFETYATHELFCNAYGIEL